MRERFRRRPSLEQLEDRWCPALTLVALDAAGNLVVSGTPNSDSVTFNFTGPDEIEVLDGATSVGTFSVPGNLRVTLGNKVINNAATGLVVSLDMNGFGLSGSVAMTLGNVINLGGGRSGYEIDDGDLGGAIEGSLSVTTGNGSDSLSLISGTTIGGSLTFNANAGIDDLILDNGAAIGGNLSAIKVNNFTLGFAPTPSSVAGQVTLNASGENVNNTYLFLGTSTDRSAVGGNVVITTGNGFLDFVDFFGTIGGSVVAKMGQGSNVLFVDSTAIILGNFTYVGGNGTDTVLFTSTQGDGATVLGNVSVVGGNGSNTFNVDTDAVIGGRSITYVGGNNVDQIVFNGLAAGARLTATLGNGTDQASFGSTVLGSAYVDFGGGIDSLILNVPALSFPLTFRNLP